MQIRLFPLILLVLLVLPGVADGKTVTEEYYTQAYYSLKELHQAIGTMMAVRPLDKTLRIFAHQTLESDYKDVRELKPPSGFEEAHDRILKAIEYRLASLQYYIQGKPDALKFWTLANAEIEAVDALLARRRADKVEAPPMDPNFQVSEIPLNVQQYGDRYLLVRNMNQLLGAKALLGAKNPARLDHALATVESELRILRQTKVPAEMKGLHGKFLEALELRKQQVQAVQANKAGDAQSKGAAAKNIFDEIDRELTEKYKITIPKNLH